MPGGPPSSSSGLALWRGPPLSDFAAEPFAQDEIGRLEELRLRRSRSESRPTSRSAATRARTGARGARPRAPPPRAAARPAHARALPLGPPGGGARGLPPGAEGARGGARPRAGPQAAGAGARDPDPGPGAQPPARAAARLGAPPPADSSLAVGAAVLRSPAAVAGTSSWSGATARGSPPTRPNAVAATTGGRTGPSRTSRVGPGPTRLPSASARCG